MSFSCASLASFEDRRNARFRRRRERDFTLSLGGGGGGGGDTTSVTTAEPWGPQQDYLKSIFENATKLYNDKENWPGYYPGTTVAPFTPAELSAVQKQADVAYGPASHMAAQTANAQNFLLGPGLFPNTNPAMQDAVYGALTPIEWEFSNRVLPQIRGDAVQAGQYGGSRQGVAEGIAATNAIRSMADTASQMYSDAYGRGLQAMTQAQGLTPQVMQSMFLPAQAIGAAGSAQRQMDQAFYDQYFNRWNYNEWQPWEMLANYGNLISGNYGGVSSTETDKSTDPMSVLGTLGTLLLLGISFL